ncbi:hypothetical protein C8Q78DRAFT_1019558 [Trametes maxima]|nr:hypothetical protein C8Q78DRAFT_1019558 [Trametes maxima]
MSPRGAFAVAMQCWYFYVLSVAFASEFPLFRWSYILPGRRTHVLPYNTHQRPFTDAAMDLGPAGAWMIYLSPSHITQPPGSHLSSAQSASITRRAIEPTMPFYPYSRSPANSPASPAHFAARPAPPRHCSAHLPRRSRPAVPAPGLDAPL